MSPAGRKAQPALAGTGLGHRSTWADLGSYSLVVQLGNDVCNTKEAGLICEATWPNDYTQRWDSWLTIICSYPHKPSV